MNDFAKFGPYHALIVCIPVEFEVVLVSELRWHLQLDTEPMCRPTGTKRFAHFRRREFVRDGLFKSGSGKVRGGIYGELDVVIPRSFSLVYLSEWIVSFDFQGTFTRPARSSQSKYVFRYDGRNTYGSNPCSLYWPSPVNCRRRSA
jgi:hypothetical protein